MEQHNKEVTITIDGKQVKAQEGLPLLTLTRKLGIEIPTLCHNKALSPYGACRLCSVEVTNKWGKKRIVTSCNYPIEEGIVVETKNDAVIKIRKGILSLLMARCPKSVKLKNLGQAYGIQAHGFWESNPDEDCVLCGLCVRVCKELVGVSAINFAKRGVEREITAPYNKFSDDCIGCGVCAIVCPTGSKKIRIHTYATMSPLKGTRDEIFGVHTDIFSVATSGGQRNFIKELLAAGLKDGLFDTAVFAQLGNQYNAEATIAETIEAIEKSKEAPPLRIKLMTKLLEAIEQGKRKIAFVGLPCQVRAVRKMQQTLQQEMPDLDITSIGIFCRHSFNNSKLKKEVETLFGLNIDKAEEAKVVGGTFVIKAADKTFSCEINQLDNAVENGCLYCNDFPAAFADLAVGSEGSAEGFSTVIVRTTKGLSLLKKLELTKGKIQKEEVSTQSENKKKRAKDNITPILQEIMEQRGKKVE